MIIFLGGHRLRKPPSSLEQTARKTSLVDNCLQEFYAGMFLWLVDLCSCFTVSTSNVGTISLSKSMVEKPLVTHKKLILEFFIIKIRHSPLKFLILNDLSFCRLNSASPHCLLSWFAAWRWQKNLCLAASDCFRLDKEYFSVGAMPCTLFFSTICH